MLSVIAHEYLPRLVGRTGYQDLLTSTCDAIDEIEERAKDEDLKRRVEEYLGGDIPAYFANGPILYMARHVATPNFETLRFLHLVEPLTLPAYIGQDPKDTFVHQNQLKKALGKLPVHLGSTMKHKTLNERYQYETIVDFSKADGRQFSSIETDWGESLLGFHNDLLAHFSKVPVQVVDDSAWIDRNCRGDLRAHYARFLALFVAHGVLFEDYLIDDKEEETFVRDVLRPAYKQVERELGARPLIVRLTPTSIESHRFWMSYPRGVLDAVRERRDARRT